MKAIACIALLGAVGLAFGLRHVRASVVPSAAHYRFEVRPEEGRVGVTLELDHVGPGPFVLFGALEERLLGVEGLRAHDGNGGALEVAAVTGSTAAPRYEIDARDGGRVVLEYSVATAEYCPPNGRREVRRCGTIGPEGCALALPNVALIPELPLVAVHLETRVPAVWDLALPFPERIVAPGPGSWWDGVLVARAARGAVEAVGASVALSRPLELEPELLGAVRGVVTELERLLGPTTSPLELVLAPGPEGPTVELPDLVAPAVLDLRHADPESLRNLVRALVPRWLASGAPADARGPTWFAEGLCEYLAQTVSERVAPSGRLPRANLEWTWMREPGLSALRPEDAHDPVSRRLLAAGLVADLARVFEQAGDSLEGALAGHRGFGLPVFVDPSRAARLASFVASRLERREPLSFEADWDLRLARFPGSARAALPIEGRLEVVFTSDTNGYLEGCGCKLSQSGGIAERAGHLMERRTRPGEFLLVDLGNLSPTEAGRPTLDALTEEELHLYLWSLEHMGYDAVCVGPEELYSGCPELRAPGSGAPPWIGLGVRVGERAPYPAARVLRRAGRRIGIVGYTELLEQGPLHQAQEPNMRGVSFPSDLAALQHELARLRPEVDLLVVAGRMRPSSLRALCAPGSGVDLVLVGGYQGYPALERDSEGLQGSAGFLGDTAVVFDQMGFLGLDHVVLLLSAEGPVGVELRPTPIEPDGPEDPEVRARLERFAATLSERPEVLAETKPLFAWDPWQQGDYVGTSRCASCHEAEARHWRTTAHATAMETLKSVRRNRHPKCVGCHVVGLGTESGFQLAEPSPELEGVACEVCHGAGGAHARDPRAGAIRRSPERAVCLECHDAEHSQDFPTHFQAAWSQVAHPRRPR